LLNPKQRQPTQTHPTTLQGGSNLASTGVQKQPLIQGDFLFVLKRLGLALWSENYSLSRQSDWNILTRLSSSMRCLEKTLKGMLRNEMRSGNGFRDIETYMSYIKDYANPEVKVKYLEQQLAYKDQEIEFLKKL